MLQPESKNFTYLAVTRSKAKMFEFKVPLERHIDLSDTPIEDMLDLTIGMLAEMSKSSHFEPSLENIERLIFIAQYINALGESDRTPEIRGTLNLLASAAFYLSGFPGSSTLVARKILDEEIRAFDLIEKMLYALLTLEAIHLDNAHLLEENYSRFTKYWNQFLATKTVDLNIFTEYEVLREEMYASGSDKHLVLINVAGAILRVRTRMSIGVIVGEFSDAPIELWNSYISRQNSISEFWPSQYKLARAGVLRGKSALIQMPTSAGKTRATEFIIRSAFLARRANMVIVVAPYRALCQEIYLEFLSSFRSDEGVEIRLMSDVIQDEAIENIESATQLVLVLTPEKMDILLKHQSSLVEHIGLVIYDEGHIFDDESRGIKYELLLSYLKTHLSPNVQTVLISGVISNGKQVKQWLLGERGDFIDGEGLNTTTRNIALVDWKVRVGNINFVSESNLQRDLFFVPSVLTVFPLRNKARESLPRTFPQLAPGSAPETTQIAAFLVCRLSSSGLVSIFAGRKDSAEKIARIAVEAYDRGLSMPSPLEYSDNIVEATILNSYIESLMGIESVISHSSKLGILIHHGAIPQGLRLSQEYALAKGHFKSVICTSTLAQGVNLPVRYLVISSLSQGENPISVRDFHNLMGRAGRAGSYTEGTVIIADPSLSKNSYSSIQQQRIFQNLLNPQNAEPSMSLLLDLARKTKLYSERGNVVEDKKYLDAKKELQNYLLNALAHEQYLEGIRQVAQEVALSTLGYSQCEFDEDRELIIDMFVRYAEEIFDLVPELSRRSILSRSCLNILESTTFMSECVQSSMFSKIEFLDVGDPLASQKLLEILWPLIYKYMKSKYLLKFNEEHCLSVCNSWLSGTSFFELQMMINEFLNSDYRRFSISNVIETCENDIGFQLSLLIGSALELMRVLYVSLSEEIENQFLILQSRLKYGLKNLNEVTLYEMGFSDRNLCAVISTNLGMDDSIYTKRETRSLMMANQISVETLLSVYPAYFRMRFHDFMRVD